MAAAFPPLLSALSMSLSSSTSSAEEVSTGSRSPSVSGRSYTTLLVGDHDFYRVISRVFAERAYRLPLVLCEEKGSDHLTWIRDSAIGVGEHTFLIPSAFNAAGKTPEANHVKSSLTGMLRCNQLRFSRKQIPSDVGSGMKPHIREKAAEFLESIERCPIDARSCIEGGNCLAFTRTDSAGSETRHALIGEGSVWLTTFLAEHRAYFASSTSSTLPELQYESIWIGKIRNHCLDPSLSISYMFSPEEHDEATKLSSVYSASLQMIQEELKVESLVCLLQVAFHIDFQVFVAPDGWTVFVDSTALTLELLEKETLRNPDLILYLETARALEAENKLIETENKRRLLSAGYRVVEIPGNLQVKPELVSRSQQKILRDDFGGNLPHSKEIRELHINFMNGVYLPNGAWLVAGIHSPAFTFYKDAFRRIYQKHMGKDAEIWFVDDPALSKILTRSLGGIHCTTLEV